MDRLNYTAIAIGCSAGGLAALSFLLAPLPANYALPVMVVQHRMADERDLLEELLQAKCRVRVKQADEKEEILPSTVYVAPPNYHLHVERDRTFSLSIDEPVRFSRPSVDVLFESAAVTYREGLIAIVLTGANDDGAEGVSMVRKHGGMTIAQDPASAEFDSMPRAAISTNAVQKVLTLAAIKNYLLSISYER